MPGQTPADEWPTRVPSDGVCRWLRISRPRLRRRNPPPSRKDDGFPVVKPGMRSHRTSDSSGSADLDPRDRRQTRCLRALTATACLSLLAGGMIACATNANTPAEAAPAPADSATSTTGPSTTVTASPATNRTTTTTPPPSVPATTTTSAPTTTVPSVPGNASDYIHATFDAWVAGDRTAAARVAEPAAVDTLFARTWTQADSWTFTRCEGAAGSVFCIWQRPGEELLIKAPNTSGGAPVDSVQFRASA